jgi:anti-anti-sigma factor
MRPHDNAASKRRDTAVQMTAALQVGVEASGRSATVRVSGELDLATAPVLTAELAKCRRSCDRVTLDIRGLDFMDCSGVRCLLDAGRRGDLTVVPGAGPVRQLLALTGADKRLALVGVPLAKRAA